MKNALFFVAGAAIGSVVTWKLLEKKYKDLADEEIASVVETFKEKEKNIKKSKEDIKQSVDKVLKKKKSKKEVDDIVVEEGYSVEPIIENEVKYPYVISPEEFGEYNEYGTKTLTYYADNVLTDEIDVPITISDMKDMIGPDALSHFGEYEDDSVYIRDEINEIDYEILKSEEKFSEIPKKGRSN